MLAAFSESFYAQVIGSIAVVVAAVIPVMWQINRKQNQVHRDNRMDHQTTSELVTEMHVDMGYVKQDMLIVKTDLSRVKGDVSHIKTDMTNHSTRLSDLELDLSKAEGSVTIPIAPERKD